MEGLMPATTTATQIQRNYRKIVKDIKKSKEPMMVLSNNKPDLIVIDYESFKNDYRKVERPEKEKYDFSDVIGSMSEKEANELNRYIDEMFENIDEEEWK